MNERTDPVEADIVVLARFTSLPEADAARSALEAAGIEVFLADESIVGTNWLYSNAVGGIRLQVLESDVERATEVLAGLPFAPPEGAEDAIVPESAAAPESVVPLLSCNECGSTDIAKIPRGTIVLIVVALATGVAAVSGLVALPLLFAAIVGVLLLFGPTHKCRNCSHAMYVEGATQPPAASAEEVVEEETEPPDVVCPACGSSETVAIARRRIKGATLMMIAFGIVLWLPMLLIWPFLPKHQCDQCGKKF